MVNDSAGTDVILVDKSQRPASAEGFKAAVAIEAERGLCNKPAFITGTDDFVKVFGNPSFDKYGQANLEAYFLVQNNVPLVISRAKNPVLDANAPVFGCLQVQVQEDGTLFVNPDMNANAISTPVEDNTAHIYFKGEGNYCSKMANGRGNPSNIVLRFSKPASESAYAEKKRVFQLQVFDFAGQNHIDSDQDGILGITPNLESVLGGGTSGDADMLALSGYTLNFDTGSGESAYRNEVVVFVNGRKGSAPYSGGSIYSAIESAVRNAAADAVAKGIKSFAGLLDFRSNFDGTFTVDKGKFNCFNLSISVSISATALCGHEDGTNLRGQSFNYGCGSVTVVPDREDPSVGTATFALSAGLYLENRPEYMYMGDENEAWAAYYAAYLKESFIASFSYDDYDPSYVSMQLDSVLAASNYLVGKTSDVFDDYEIKFSDNEPDWKEKASPMIANLQYFDTLGSLFANSMDPGQRSYAYALALREIMGNNLAIWRCVATPNLGDVMNKPDFIGVIEAAGETTVGISNIGKAASLDVFSNTDGRHGNRFIVDLAQYGRRNVAGRRMWLTMAALVTLTLNDNYLKGNEARPPMGLSYGPVQCDALSEEFTGPQRKLLSQTYKLNPVINEGGFYLWANTTSQIPDSALSDIHVILSYCWMKYMIWESMRPFVAEYNDTPTITEGIRVLNGLNRTFISRNYIEEGKPNADKNVIGDKVMRFDFPVRFKGVAIYVDIYVTAYPQTQSLEISLSEEG